MVETGAQKRKAEDENAALASDTLGEPAQPAAKKVKSEHDAAPIKSETADTDVSTTGIASESQQAAQDVKQEESVSAAEAHTEAKPDAVNGDTTMSSAEAQTDPDPPQTLGYKTFKDGDEAFQYFHDLVHDLRHNQDLNEVSQWRFSNLPQSMQHIQVVFLLQYEHKAVLDLVKKGHPEADTKVHFNLHGTVSGMPKRDAVLLMFVSASESVCLPSVAGWRRSQGFPST